MQIFVLSHEKWLFYLCWGFYVLISTARKIFESSVTVVSKSADYKKLGHESTSHHKISLYLDFFFKKLNETLKKRETNQNKLKLSTLKDFSFRLWWICLLRLVWPHDSESALTVFVLYSKHLQTCSWQTLEIKMLHPTDSKVKLANPRERKTTETQLCSKQTLLRMLCRVSM